MSKQDDENATAKLEELILKTKAEIYQCFKWLLWICCISVGLLACWVEKVQYYAVGNTYDGSDNIHRDSRYKSFKAFDQDRDGFINIQPEERSQIVLDELKRIEEEQGKLHALINDLQLKLTDSELAQWGPWGTWSDCYMNCTGKHGGRLQNRSRETKSKSVVQGHQKETEERPCNAVQFAGCIKSYGTDDNFGVNYDFADQMAVSTCTALSGVVGHIYAVRRRCSSLSVSCAETCKQIGATCFNSLHIYQSGILPDQETRGFPFKASRSGSKRQNSSRSGSFLAYFYVVQEKWPLHNSFQPTSHLSAEKIHLKSYRVILF